MNLCIRFFAAITSMVTIGVTVSPGGTWDEPYPRVFGSQRGSYGLKVLPQSKDSKEPFGKSSDAVLFVLENDGKEKVIWREKLVNLPSNVYVVESGVRGTKEETSRVVTVDTYGGTAADGKHAVVIYDAKGKVLADYGIGDLLTKEEIRKELGGRLKSMMIDCSEFSPKGDSRFVITLRWKRTITINLQTGKIQ